MITAPEHAAYSRSRWLDLSLTLFAGGALLFFSWRDVQLDRATRDRDWPDFALVSAPGDVRIGPWETFRSSGASVQIHNIGQLEQNWVSRFRHGLGPVSTIEIHAETNKRARIEFELHNSADDQTINVSWNDAPLEQIHLGDGVLKRKYVVDLREDNNRLAIAYARYNGVGEALSAQDPRPLAVTFHHLNIFLQ